MVKKLTILSVVLLLAACASAGKPIDKTHMDEIANGVQTKAQIRQWFGEPYTVKTGLAGHPDGCVERWTYEYAKARGFGKVTYSEVLVVDFDAAGKVCDHAYSKTGNP
jgi:outer membrane protein assembly factor BamE (lipoprotein component of BamABCDE complex)